MPALLLLCSLLEQHQRLRREGEDAEDDGKDEEMTSVWDRLEWCVDECVCGSPGVPVAFNQKRNLARPVGMDMDV